MTDYTDEHFALSDQARAALQQFRADFGGTRYYVELIGRLTWLAPEAVLQAVEEQRAQLGREGTTP